jgi:hypothetical protein
VNRPETRKVTRQLLEKLESGEIEPLALAKNLLSNFMSEADVADFAHSEGYIEEEKEDEGDEP